MAPPSIKSSFAASIAVPALVFVLLSALASLVWYGQRTYERSLIQRHTEDICLQAARRTEIFMTSQLRMAEIFARRWAKHPTGDYSHERFTSFSSVLMEQSPGLERVFLVAPAGGDIWQTPVVDGPLPDAQAVQIRALVQAADPTVSVSISEPYRAEDGGHHIALILPLRNEEGALGAMVFEIHTRTLIDSCFHEKIASEFLFSIRDEREEIFSSAPEADFSGPSTGLPVVRRRFPVANQEWELTMSPRPEVQIRRGALADLAVPLFGYLTSLCLALLVWALQRRMRALELARRQHVLLSRKVLAAQEEERARLSRELHDELGQVLTALRLEVGWLFEGRERSHEEMRDIAANTVQLVDGATEQLRRICRGLHPPMLHDLGLEPVARQLIEEFGAVSLLPVQARLDLDEERATLSADAALCAYRVLQEALNNIVKHAQATRVDVALYRDGAQLILEVADDGRGFDSGALVGASSCGIEGMSERAALAGGALQVETAPGGGCRIRLTVPASAEDTRKRKGTP